MQASLALGATHLTKRSFGSALAYFVHHQAYLLFVIREGIVLRHHTLYIYFDGF